MLGFKILKKINLINHLIKLILLENFKVGKRVLNVWIVESLKIMSLTFKLCLIFFFSFFGKISSINQFTNVFEVVSYGRVLLSVRLQNWWYFSLYLYLKKLYSRNIILKKIIKPFKTFLKIK